MKSLDKQDWKKRFEKQLGKSREGTVFFSDESEKEVKSFIQSELDRQIDEILGLEILKEEKIKYGRAGALERNRCDQHEAFHLGEKAGKYYKIEEIKEVINSLKKQ